MQISKWSSLSSLTNNATEIKGALFRSMNKERNTGNLKITTSVVDVVSSVKRSGVSRGME